METKENWRFHGPYHHGQRWRIAIVSPDRRIEYRSFKTEREAIRELNYCRTDAPIRPSRRSKRAPWRRESFVYFVRHPDGGPIKIGTTTNLKRRLDAFRTVLGKVEVLGVVEGVAESALHERFAHLREYGEWFRADNELLSYIATNTKR